MALAERFAAAWSLRFQHMLPVAGPARLFAVEGPFGPAVLKLAPPGQGLASEAAALARFAGRGAVRLFAADLDAGALLLERAVPGTPLDPAVEADLRTAGRLMRALPCPAPAGVPLARLAGWGRALEWPAARAALRAAVLGRAAELLAALGQDAAPEMLLHGDLHCRNILRHGEGWIAVDPKGLLGEPPAEAFRLLTTPPRALSAALAARRVAVLAEAMEQARDRVAAWCWLGAVLAACWAAEDGGAPAAALAAAEALEPLLAD